MSLVKHSIIRFGAVALAAAVGFLSCAQIDEGHGAVGYLEFPALEIDASVDNLMDTKALELPDLPSSADLEVVVTDADGQEHDFTPGERLALPVGSFTITAFYGSNSFGTPYLSGTASGTISPVEVSAPSLEVTLQNSLVRVTVGESMAEHFYPDATASLTIGNETVSVPYDTWYYVPAGVDITLALRGRSSVDQPASFTYGLSGTAAATAYRVVCEKDATNWPTITLNPAGAFATRLFVAPAVVSGNISDENKGRLVYEVSESSDFASVSSVNAVSGVPGVYGILDGITSGKTYYVRARIGNLHSNVVHVVDGFTAGAVSTSHFKDAGGNLAGTNAVLNYGFSGLVKTLYDGGLLTVSSTLKRGSAFVRTATTNGVTMTDPDPSAAAPWPYLPQSPDGSAYTLDVVQTLDGGNSLTASVGGIKVASPETFISVSLGQSYTSYDYGVENSGNGFTKDVEFANGLKSESLYEVSSSWSVSDALMGNENYKSGRSANIYLKQGSTIVRTYTPTALSDSYEVGEITGLDWAQYDLLAEVSFDGVTKSDTKVHHITGLPYKMTHPADQMKYPWRKISDRLTTCDFSLGDHVYFTTSGSSTPPAIVSSDFHVPATIQIRVDSDVRLKAYKFLGIWSQTTYKVSAEDDIISQGSGKQERNDLFECSETGQLTTSYKSLKCTSTSTVAGPNMSVYTLEVYYN